MTGILLFLGAGASRVFNVPTMREFVPTLDRWVSKNARADHPLFSQVRDQVRGLYGEDVDLERVLDIIHDLSLGRKSIDVFKGLAPDAAARFTTLLSEVPQLPLAVNSLDQKIAGDRDSAVRLETSAAECIISACEVADQTKAAEVYRAFFTELSRTNFVSGEKAEVSRPNVGGPRYAFPGARVVTTNYDLCFEAFCTDSKISWDTGFQGLGADQEQSFSRAPDWNGSGFPLLKLHGSIDWWRTDTNRVIRRTHGRVNQRLLDNSRLTRMEIRYPVGSKDLFGDPYLKHYARFAEWLSTCPIWIFVGYSFGDPSIRQLVGEAMRPSTKMYVVHPHGTSEIRQRLNLPKDSKLYIVDERFPSETFIQVLRNTGPQ